MAARCEHCGRGISEATDYRLVKGYARIRRQAGGTNALRATERTQTFACQHCVDKLARGITPEQVSLL